MQITIEVDDATWSALAGGAIGKLTVLPEQHPEPEGPPAGPMAPVMNAGLLRPGGTLTWNRPRKSERYEARVLADGRLETPDGRRYNSPSGAADAVAGGSNDGWEVWRNERGESLDDLRKQLS